jgi:threonine/homoserine/homoserine lactone efflux protein
MNLLLFVFLNLLGAMSPGPDFAIVTRYAIKGSRKEALKVSLGITCALVVHVTYCLLGVAFFLQNSPSLFFSIQLFGALYLSYLGIKMMGEKPSLVKESFNVKGSKAFFEGFLTNLLNPKATLFILSLLSQFVSFDTSWKTKLVYGATLPLTAWLWFSFLSLALTHPKILERIQSYQHLFTRLMGSLLILLSLCIVVESSIHLMKK